MLRVTWPTLRGLACDDRVVEYPQLTARTDGFRAGEPHDVTVSADGQRVVFLRSPGTDPRARRLWVFDVATGSERPAGNLVGVDGYAINPSGRLAALHRDGVLVVARLDTEGEERTVRTAGPVADPRPDPNGRRVAYVTGRSVRVLDLVTGDDVLLAGELDSDDVWWGVAEPTAAEAFGRTRGYWWSPDGNAILAIRLDNARVRRRFMPDSSGPGRKPRAELYPVAGTPYPDASLHLLDLDGGWVDIHWDRETYPYVASVSWSDVGGPLVTVLRRLQQHGLVLAIDPRTGETQVHAELADPRWVEPIAGSPRYLPDGRVLIGGELASDGYDARCLFADGGLLTPPSLYVRRVRGMLGHDLLLEASEGEPSEQHLYRVSTRPAAAAMEVQRLTPRAGWHVGYVGGKTLVVGSRSLDHTGTQWTVYARGAVVGRLKSESLAPPYAPRPVLERVTDRRLPTGVVYPRAHVTGRRLPVLVDIHGGPGHQEVVAARENWLERQWWADAGFGVVVVDNRGTPGIAPSFEKVVHRRIADIALADQVDALTALAEKHPDLDLSRVAIRGRFFGGWLAALAALRRPDVYGCAVAAWPICDWTLHSAAYTERLLGLPDEAHEVYERASLAHAVEESGPRRPLLIIHQTGDAHTARLLSALRTAGHPHTVLEAAQDESDALLALELDFVRRNLSR